MSNATQAHAVARAARAVIEVLEERRLLAAGDLDPTFGGGDGIFISEHPLVPTDVAVRSDGKILVSGWGLFDVGSVIRVNPDGTKDASFGTNGLASSGHGLQNSFANAVAVGPGGRIAVVGMQQGTDPLEQPQATLILYSTEGKYLPALGHPFAASDWGPGFNDVAFTPDGKILALGRKMVRFTADGVVDRTFDGDGKKDVSGKEMIVLPDGKILVLGYFALFRFNADGTPDTSFDGDGIVPNVRGSDIALMPDGDLLVAGNGPDAKLVTRFNSNGTIDRTFGENGSATVFAGQELAVTANNIFVGGSLIGIAGPQFQFELTALTHSGRRDPAYGPTGLWTTLVGGISSKLVDLAIQQGKLLAVGEAVVQVSPPEGATEIHPGLARYEVSGTTPPPPGQTPFSGTPFSLPAVIQAEDFDEGGEGVAYHDTESRNLGGAYRPGEGVDIQTRSVPQEATYVGFVKAGEWLEYTINLQTAGAYDFHTMASHLRAGGQFHWELDGRRITPNMTVPTTANWEQYRAVAARNVTLPAGRHVLRLAFDANGALGYVGNFDFVVVAPTAGGTGQRPFRGSPYTPGDEIEAEDFDEGGQGVSFRDVTPANEGGVARDTPVDIQPTTDVGGGFNVGWLKPGEWLEYTVDVPEGAGRFFDFTFRVASQGSGGRVRVTANDIFLDAFTVPDTGGWQSWQNVVLRNREFRNEGIHVIRLYMEAPGPTGFVVNLNRFEFQPSRPTPIP